jgi:hypothetical protein
MPPPGAFCWESLNAADAGAVVPFYESAVGWKKQDQNGMPLFFTGGAGESNMVADIGTAPPGMPTHWVTHVVVPKLEDARAKVEKLGGKIMMPEVPVPGIGRLAIVSDPTGAVLSLFEAAPRQ